MIFSDDVRDSLPVHLPIMYIAFRSEDIVEKLVFGPPNFTERGYPIFRACILNRTHFEHVGGFG